MTRWQRFLILLMGKIRLHHGRGEYHDLPAFEVFYSGVNAKQKKFRNQRIRAMRREQA